MAKRVRRFSISRNKQYGTQQLDGQTIEASIWNFRYDLKVKSETFKYLLPEWQS